MIIDDFRSAEFSDLGSAAGLVRYTLLMVVLTLVLVAGYYLLIEDKTIELKQSQQQELVLKLIVATQSALIFQAQCSWLMGLEVLM